MKTFNGKSIYQPAGKAGEYVKWACNFYVGCSNGCEYCYCKKGILANVMGQDKPQLKKCFSDELHAWGVFMREVAANFKELQQHGLFFSFTTDPMLPETKDLTIDAIRFCVVHDIPVKVLTKCTEWLEPFLSMIEDNVYVYNKKNLIAFGVTLTGHDELEKGASTNEERIEAMRKLHSAGFKTFTSIEPIIDFKSSLEMIKRTIGFCDLYKIGLKAGDKWSSREVRMFISDLTEIIPDSTSVYLKDSIVKQLGIERGCLGENYVGADYSMFK